MNKDVEIKERVMAIGSHYKDEETGENIVPVYYKNPSTGVVTPRLVVVGKNNDQSAPTKEVPSEDGF